MKLKNLHIIDELVAVNSPEELDELGHKVREEGYSGLNELLEGLKERLKWFDEEESDDVGSLLAKASRLVPDPGSISPAWERIWEKLNHFLQYKREVFEKIGRSEREGEWQIVMDNPYTNESVVCYPSLSFLEAAYLYAYFRDDLQPNEYIRIQKVVNLLVSSGE